MQIPLTRACLLVGATAHVRAGERARETGGEMEGWWGSWGEGGGGLAGTGRNRRATSGELAGSWWQLVGTGGDWRRIGDTLPEYEHFPGFFDESLMLNSTYGSRHRGPCVCLAGCCNFFGPLFVATFCVNF